MPLLSMCRIILLSVRSHGVLYGRLYIIPSLRRPFRVSILSPAPNSSIIMPDFFSNGDGHEVSGGDFIATPGDPNAKYFSDCRNMKIMGGRYGTMDRTETQSSGESSSNATHSSTFSRGGSDRYSHSSRQGTGRTAADQQGAWSSSQFRLDSLTPRSILSRYPVSNTKKLGR